MIKLVESLDLTVEQVKQLITELTEIPKNKSMLVVKKKSDWQISQESGLQVNQSFSERDASERKVLKPFYVLAVSEDMEDKSIQPLDKVRVSRITEPQGIPIECSIQGYQIVIIREFDVFTVIKNYEA